LNLNHEARKKYIKHNMNTNVNENTRVGVRKLFVKRVWKMVSHLSDFATENSIIGLNLVITV